MVNPVKFLVLTAFLTAVTFNASLSSAKSIGVAAAVNQNAHAVSLRGKIRSIKLGNKVYFNERINTEGVGIVQLLFTDGSTIMVGANSSLVIDEYIYDPNKGTGKLAISFGKGVMRFIGGKLSKNKNGVEIRTVVGTAGIRGGMANIGVSQNKGVFSFLYGTDLTFTGLNGERRRIYTQGYTLLAETSRGQTYKRLVIRRTLRGDTTFFARKLAGGISQNGGARVRPTNNQVQRSAVSQGGSSVPFSKVKPKDLPTGVVATSRDDLERDRLDSNLDFDRTIICPAFAPPTSWIPPGC